MAPSPKSHVYPTFVPSDVTVKNVSALSAVGPCTAVTVLIGSSVTVMTTEAGAPARSRASVTSSVKVSTTACAGAMKVGVTAVALLSNTGVPPLCVQKRVKGR